MSTILFLPLFTGRYSPVFIEDLLPGIFIYALSNNRQVFDQDVDNLCSLIPDSDLVMIEEESIRKDCEALLNTFVPRIRELVPLNAEMNILEKLKDLGSIEVNVVDNTQVVVEIKSCQEI